MARARGRVATGALVSALVIVFVGCARACAAARTLDVALSAGWRSTSGALESCVTVADVDRNAFWTLVEALDAVDIEGGEYARACEAAWDEAAMKALGGESIARAAALARGLRASSPRVAAIRELARADVGDANGCCRVKIGGETISDVEALRQVLLGEVAVDAETRADARDATRREFDAALPTALAYAAPGTDCFREMHDVLSRASDEGKLNYVLRPTLFAGCARKNSCVELGETEDNLRLAGFGIELAVKNMEYKAIDDSKVKTDSDGDAEDDGEDNEQTSATTRDELLDETVHGFNFAKLAKHYPDDIDGLRVLRDELVRKAELSSDEPLKLWDINNLGLQATQYIAHAEDPLQALVDLSQNFPSLANALSRIKLNSTIVREVKANHRVIPPGGLVMSLNGENLELDTIDIYTLTEIITKEIRYAESLRQLGLPPSVVSKLLRIPKRSKSGPKVNMTDDSIIYFNDVETDVKFSKWSKDVNRMKFQVQGGFDAVRYNFFNLAVFLDPSDPSTWDIVIMMDHYYERSVPLRMAQIIATGMSNPDPEVNFFKKSKKQDAAFATAVARAANYLLNQYGASVQHEFLSMIARSRRQANPPSYFAPASYFPPTWDTVREAFSEVIAAHGDDSEYDASDLLEEFRSESSPKADRYVEAAVAAVSAKGLTTQSFIMNGVYVDEATAWQYQAPLEHLISHYLRQEMERMQRLAVIGKLAAGTSNMIDFVQEGAMSKYVPWILDEQNFPPTYQANIEHTLITSLEYAQSGEPDAVKPVSVTIVADADSERGGRLIAAAAKHVVSRSGTLSRFTVVHPMKKSKMGTRARAIQAALHVPTRKAKVVNFIEDFLTSNADASAEEAAERSGLHVGDFRRLMSDEQLEHSVLEQSKRFVSHHKLESRCAVVANGRVLNLETRQCSMDADELGVLVEAELAHGSRFVSDAITSELLSESDPIVLSRMISDTAALMAVKQSGASNKRTVESLDKFIRGANKTSFSTGEGSMVRIEAILDPLSKEAQRVAPVLALLRDRLSEEVTIRVVLNPARDLQDLPLKSYYRYVVPPTSITEPPLAVITNVPTHKTLTMHVDFPEPWMVTTQKATYDLDNLILKDVKEKAVHAEYRLESLLVTGHVSDGKSRQPARGTQLILEDNTAAVNPGTIVMANLGYFQLPASPGFHKISLREGRSADIFAFGEVRDLLDSTTERLRIASDGLAVEVLVDSFRGRQLDITLNRRAGMEKMDVLDADASAGGFWLSKMFKKKDAKDEERIHIFSVASGHLYERFLKIMMASVKRSTKKNPVKFWFIKNWLSPSFKDFLPHMAKKYGFEFELVSYKWPTWLNKQTEKQRIIWAYKILFLDVLFPLELHKVIFVDADQIVRADMSELWNMDLHGAPYGYTPMCDNNKEMEGFRFWKQGFWQTHLRGKPYHISALYVVDLDRFRALAAGDRLRVMYDSLSRDPGSLANLDQDLPNYAQHDVPIFSLPQPWLWCESWCGNETKSAAKTIDLCNNPLTKEPKLEGARRIVKEWPELDAEVRAFTEQVEKGWKVRAQTNSEHDEL